MATDYWIFEKNPISQQLTVRSYWLSLGVCYLRTVFRIPIPC